MNLSQSRYGQISEPFALLFPFREKSETNLGKAPSNSIYSHFLSPPFIEGSIDLASVPHESLIFASPPPSFSTPSFGVDFPFFSSVVVGAESSLVTGSSSSLSSFIGAGEESFSPSARGGGLILFPGGNEDDGGGDATAATAAEADGGDEGGSTVDEDGGGFPLGALIFESFGRRGEDFDEDDEEEAGGAFSRAGGGVATALTLLLVEGFLLDEDDDEELLVSDLLEDDDKDGGFDASAAALLAAASTFFVDVGEEDAFGDEDEFVFASLFSSVMGASSSSGFSRDGGPCFSTPCDFI